MTRSFAKYWLAVAALFVFAGESSYHRWTVHGVDVSILQQDVLDRVTSRLLVTVRFRRACFTVERGQPLADQHDSLYL
jgi:hypothetical protein